MSRSIFVQVEPLILKYARYCAGYDVINAAKKLKITEEKLRELEEHKQDISLGQLKKLSDVYKMPIAYFLLSNAPADLVVPKDFRIIFASEEEKLSHAVMLAVRKARYVQSNIQSLQQEKEIEYNFKNVTIDDNREELAKYFRNILSVSLDEQKKWANSTSAIRGWKDAIEKLGIFVLQESLPKDDISAFCLADKKPYIISLNSAEHENRRIFSLFHEIGHILLHRSGICTPSNFSRNSYEYVKIEKFCNQFAAALLVPVEDFRANDLVNKIAKITFTNWDQNDIKSLSILYRVSQEVIYRRLVQVGILDEKKYEQRRDELIKGFEEYKRIPKKSVPIPQYRKIISRNGKAYSAVVLENLHSNRITLSDAADYLGTNTRHVFDVSAHI